MQVVLAIVAFFSGFALCAMICLTGRIDTEERMFEYEKRIAKTNDYINVVVRSDYEIGALEILTTIQEILDGDK